MAKRAKKPVSKKQAALFGAVAAGKSTKASGLSKKAAKKKLKGVKLKGLPGRAKKRRK